MCVIVLEAALGLYVGILDLDTWIVGHELLCSIAGIWFPTEWGSMHVSAKIRGNFGPDSRLNGLLPPLVTGLCRCGKFV